MAFESLEPQLAEHLNRICEAQMSGRFEPHMLYQPSKGLRGRLRLGENPGSEELISDTIDRGDLRNLATHDYLSIATPRSHWYVAATAKALTEYTEDRDGGKR